MIIKNNKCFKKNIRKLLTLAAVFCLSASLVSGCKKQTDNEDVEFSKAEDEKVTAPAYSIRIINSRTGSQNDKLLKGYKAALDDLFGKDSYSLEIQNVGNKAQCDEAVLETLKSAPDLIMADGYMAICEASAGTTVIPIVGTGILNFQAMLHTGNENILDATGTNITGTSTMSPAEDILSLMIESQPSLNTVGLLYSPEDNDAIYQNEALELLLDQAQIPWREYELTSTDEAKSTSFNSYFMAETASPESNTEVTAIAPGKTNITSSSQGPDQEADSIGEPVLITTADTPTRARAAKMSALIENPVESANAIPEGATTEDIVRQACSECNVLYIPGYSNLQDQTGLIGETAFSLNVPTVTNDPESGAHTYTCLYTDSFAMGYEAGKQTFRILKDGEHPSEMSIEKAPAASAVKLYTEEGAKVFDRTFPKSFYELTSYLSDTAAGATTKRVTDE